MIAADVVLVSCDVSEINKVLSTTSVGKGYIYWSRSTSITIHSIHLGANRNYRVDMFTAILQHLKYRQGAEKFLRLSPQKAHGLPNRSAPHMLESLGLGLWAPTRGVEFLRRDKHRE